MLPYILAPQMMDYLRVVFLFKGNILFVEDDNISINSKPSKLVLRTALLFCLTHFFKCSVYETWALVNSQVTIILQNQFILIFKVLFFSLPFAHLSMMSNLMIHHLKLAQVINIYFFILKYSYSWYKLYLKSNVSVDVVLSF